MAIASEAAAKTKPPLTGRQYLTLEFIEDFIDCHRRPPVQKEVGRAFDITANAVKDRVAAMRRKGALKNCSCLMPVGKTPGELIIDTAVKERPFDVLLEAIEVYRKRQAEFAEKHSKKSFAG